MASDNAAEWGVGGRDGGEDKDTWLRNHRKIGGAGPDEDSYGGVSCGWASERCLNRDDGDGGALADCLRIMGNRFGAISELSSTNEPSLDFMSVL